MTRIDRRRLLQSVAGVAAAAGVAGCTGGSGGTDRGTNSSGDGDSGASGDGTSGGTGDGNGTASVDNDIGDWPVVGYDHQRTSHAPDGSGPDEKVSKTWETTVADRDDGPDIVSPPVVASGRVFATSWAKQLHALSAADGRILWEFDLDERKSGPPAFGSGTVVVSTNSGTYAVSADSGSERWRSDVGSASSPMVVDDTVFVVGGEADEANGRENSVTALSLEDGSQQWQASEAYATSNAGFAYADGTIVTIRTPVGGFREVAAFDATSGEKLWEAGTYGNRMKGHPVIADGTVYCMAAGGGATFALDLASGEELWRTGDQGEVSPAVANGTVYVAAGTQKLFALDAASGEREWVYETDRWLMKGAPAVVDGTVYARSNAAIVSLSPDDGSQNWRHPVPGAGPHGIAVADGRIFTTTTVGKVLALTA